MSFKRNKINNNSSFLGGLTKLIFVILIAGVGYTYNDYNNFINKSLVNDEFIIEIKEGYTFDDLALELNINKYYLKYFHNNYLKTTNSDFKLIAGNYKISKNSDIKNILKGLEEPIIFDEINLTILEGWNIYDIDEYLNKKELIETGEYIAYVNNIDKILKLKEFFPFLDKQETLEGYLYPDTYKVVKTPFKINNFVIKQLEGFENKVYNTILKELSNKEILDLINLASIVEKEEKNPEEKSSVAGILKKRLDSEWMIGADITVCYPHELTSQQCKMVVSKYINEKSEYNTRTMKGLPKTPIGSPSFDTINATLNYKETAYWFYLHDTTNGKIYYAKDNAGHEKNKNLYIK